MGTSFVCSVLLCLVLLTASGFAKPHIVVVLSDDHGAFDSSVYGAADIHTPNMQRLAGEGMVFDAAFAASPTCAPNRAAMLTGLMPARNGAEANQTAPREGIKKLPAYLRELGYEVAAFGKVAHYRQTAGYGFDHFAHIGTDHFRDEMHDRRIVSSAIEWLRMRGSGSPLCIFIGLNAPHVPWPLRPEGYDADGIKLPPTHLDTPDTRQARARYHAAISRMDDALGDAIDAARAVLGMNVLILHSSDHGGHWPFAKWTCYDAGIRVPMIAVWPGRIRPGVRTSAMVSWIDILPTLIEIGGGRPPAELDGRSFASVLLGESMTHRERVFSTHSSDGVMNVYPVRSMRTPDWKYILNLRPDFLFTCHVDLDDRPQRPGYFKSWREAARENVEAAALLRRYHEHPGEELYNLAADPFEMHNLAPDPRHARRLESMREELRAWMREQGDSGRVIGKPRLRSAAQTGGPPALAEK